MVEDSDRDDHNAALALLLLALLVVFRCGLTALHW